MAGLSTTFGGRAQLAAALLLASPLLIGGTGRLTSLDDRLLAAHNRERTASGIPALAWDPVLVAEARAWGEELAEIGRAHV